MVWGNCHKITTEVHSVRKHILVIFWGNGARASTNMRHLKHHTVLKILSKTYWACTLVTLKHAMFPHQNWSVITQHKIPSYLIIWLIGFLLLWNRFRQRPRKIYIILLAAHRNNRGFEWHFVALYIPYKFILEERKRKWIACSSLVISWKNNLTIGKHFH